MAYLYAIALTVLAWCAAVEAVDSQDPVTWIFPKGGEMFYYLDTVNVTYQSPYSNPWMYIFCYQDSTVNSVSEIRWQEADAYDESMLISLQFTTATSCWFNLRANFTGNAGSNSKQWMLADVERPGGPITTGAAGAVSTATATSAALTVDATATATSDSDSASKSTASNKSSDGRLTQGAKIGVGIGIGLGTSILCAGLFWWYHRHLKQKEHEKEVYRKVMGRNDDGAGSSGSGGFAKRPVDRVNEWRYRTQHPLDSVTGSSYSMASAHSNDWHNCAPGTPFQYYDPTSDGHPGRTSVAATATTLAPSVPVQVAATYELQPSHVNVTPSFVPESVSGQDVAATGSGDLEAGNAAAPSNTAQRSMPSVNYGPTGRLDAGTGADFSLLPDYQSPINGGPVDPLQYDSMYEARTPSTPPPPHSAHTRTTRPSIPSVAGSTTATPSIAPSELPTEQTHRGFGPDAELPGDLQQPMLRHQRSHLHDAEQKFLVADVIQFRNAGGPSTET